MEKVDLAANQIVTTYPTTSQYGSRMGQMGSSQFGQGKSQFVMQQGMGQDVGGGMSGYGQGDQGMGVGRGIGLGMGQ